MFLKFSASFLLSILPPSGHFLYNTRTSPPECVWGWGADTVCVWNFYQQYVTHLSAAVSQETRTSVFVSSRREEGAFIFSQERRGSDRASCVAFSSGVFFLFWWSSPSTLRPPMWRTWCSDSRCTRRAEAPCASPGTTCSSRTGSRAAVGRCCCCSSGTSMPSRKGETLRTGSVHVNHSMSISWSQKNIMEDTVLLSHCPKTLDSSETSEPP